MDIKNLKAPSSAEIELFEYEGGPSTGIFITLAHRDHPDVQAAARAIADKRLATISRRGSKALKADDLEAETLDVLCASVLGWRGLEAGDEPWPFNEANVRQLLQQHAWIRRQLNKAQEDEALFFGN